jgi:polar amino acid transport system ATP-binding protein
MNSEPTPDQDFFGNPAGRGAPGALIVDLQSVYKKFGSQVALDGITLPIKAREVTGLIGPPGAGKTTMLRCIAHLDRIDAGRIYVAGGLLGYEEKNQTLRELSARQIARQRRDVGLVTATFDLFPHLSVLGNVVAAPVRVRRAKKREAVARARVLLDRLSLGACADAYPAHLTPDQRQRAALARALAMQPTVLLLDGPTSALGASSRVEVTDVIRSVAADGLSVVVATDDLEFARDVAHQIVVIDEGVVIESGDPRAVLGNPQDERARAFIAAAV